MAFVIVVLLAAAVALLTGGRLSNLKNIQFRFPWLVLAAVALKIVTNSNLRYTLGISDLLAPKLYMLSLGLVVLFVILNIGLRGLALIGLGLLSNLAAIFFNGGYMPLKREYFMLIASAEELEKINQGLPAYNYIATGPQTKLYYLSDIFLMPHWIFITKVFSVGDVLITIGGCIFVWFFLKTPVKRKNGILTSIGYRNSNNP
ncbi:hypothetical protein Psch_01598 [Pelotomaculum schinkii]|uniref:DUF5317 domain-containing protein n=1 Tax=Pelotomaculum schinkii TaxID=78350 RepID=A0A4Y7RGX6_9FIRM|nr:DUF5317 family protein [Pelotomaculum schinkii]TEB08043.1 hypothetical protein Psch_01598 [Pelotomaculum schinkii]